jgi:predicted nucleotidyltransferase
MTCIATLEQGAFEMESTPSSIAAKIRPVLSGCEEIVAAYLFGSAVSDRRRPDSDIDIAVLLDEEVSNTDRKALQESLLPPLCRALRDDVHLLVLNDASYLARSQVFSKGEPLYIRDYKLLALFRMKSFALYAEFAPYLQMTREGLRRRTRRGHGG